MTQINDRVYNNVKFELTHPGALTYFALNNVLETEKNDVNITKLEYKGTGNLKDAGTYPLVVTLGGVKAGNYTVKTIDDAGNHVGFIIKKATLTFVQKTADIEKIYGKADPDWSEVFTFTPSYGDKALTKTEMNSLVAITREEGEIVRYDKDVIKGYEITITLTAAGATNFTLDGYNDKKKPQLVIKPKTIGTDGVADKDINFETEEIEIVYKGASYQGWTDENIGVTLSYKASENDTKPMVYGTDYKIWIEGAGVDAGTALTLSIVGQGNYKGAIWHSGLKIAKADLTITGPEDESVLRKVGAGTPGDLSEYFTFEGLVGKDNDGEDKPADAWLRMIAGNNNSSVGTYTVYVYEGSKKITGTTELTNYNLTYDPVKYQILSSDFVLYGDDYASLKEGAEAPEDVKIVTNTEKLTQYAGLTVPTVKIEHLRGLNTQLFRGGRYYSLVLPFDITVRELSEQLGYAVVNIPNTTNTDGETIEFGLTITTVPANTMMLFRVDGFGDKDGKDLDDINLVFENKTIVENLETNPDYASDGAGHNFMITYEAMELKEANQYYWKPVPGNDGSVFSNALTYYQDMEKYLVVNAFNGYFEFEPNSVALSLAFGESDGSTTSINLVTGETANYAAEGWYTIGGMKLNAQPTQKGIYINNGKKVIIK